MMERMGYLDTTLRHQDLQRRGVHHSLTGKKKTHTKCSKSEQVVFRALHQICFHQQCCGSVSMRKKLEEFGVDKIVRTNSDTMF